MYQKPIPLAKIETMHLRRFLGLERCIENTCFPNTLAAEKIGKLDVVVPGATGMAIMKFHAGATAAIMANWSLFKRTTESL
jgi:hypothetical protein